MSEIPVKELIVDVVERGASPRKGAIACRLDENIEFDMKALESFSSARWEPTVFDALLVAAAVEFCDRSLARSTITWSRRFSVCVPVHDPHKWSDKEVIRTLTDALNLLTGDEWSFEFRARQSAVQPPSQEHLKFPSDVDAVIAFSDGMDSRAVAGIEGKRLGQRLVLIRLGTLQHDVSRKERSQSAFAALPYAVRVTDNRNAENSARSRGFKFSVVAAIAAYLIEAPSAIVPESGQGALAPALLPVGQGYEDYRNHPIFTQAMERFVHSLFGYRIHYEFPRLWMTKGETLREFVENCGGGGTWVGTRSCWQQSRHVGVAGGRRQCGICAACMLRRLSVHAAGLNEPPENYVWESLRARTWDEGASKHFVNKTPALREYAIAGVLHFEHLATIRKSMQYELIKRRKVGELARALGKTPQSVAANLDRLLQQHASEWKSFTNDLGKGSFVKKWIDHVL